MGEEVEIGADEEHKNGAHLVVEQGEEAATRDRGDAQRADVMLQTHHGGFSSTLREKPPFSTIRDTMDWIIGLVKAGR
jgi:hypothetical protein